MRPPCFDYRSKRTASIIEAQASEIPVEGYAAAVSESSREPIMALLDLLGRRMAMRVIWELRAEELTFRQLQQRCSGVSASTLNSRLHDLRDAGIVTNGPNGYRLSKEGHGLLQAYEPLGKWARRWAQRQTGADSA
jgi:DNA-binding HxlR family transcriptional regulator